VATSLNPLQFEYSSLHHYASKHTAIGQHCFYDCLSNVVFTSFRLVDLRIIYRQWLTVNLTASQQPAMCQVKHETPSLKTCAGTMWRLVRVTHEYGAVVEWSAAGESRCARREIPFAASPCNSNLTLSVSNEAEASRREAIVWPLKRFI